MSGDSAQQSAAGGRLSRIFAVSATALVLACTALLLHSTLVSDRVPFLTSGAEGEWIAKPMPPSTDAIFVDATNVPAITFHRNFRVEGSSPSAVLTGRALREASVVLNGSELELPGTETRWKRGFEAEIGDRLQTGRNEIRVSVRNASGPALLQLAILGDGVRVVTDATWEASHGSSGDTTFAEIASDVRLHGEAFRMPTPGSLLVEHLGAVALLFALSVGLYWLGSRLSSAQVARAPEWTLGMVTLFWLVTFVVKFAHLPVLVGFDIPAHLHYIDFLLEHRRLPLASDGWSTYHPPVFYVLTSALVAVTQVARESGAAQVLYRAIPFLAGLANVWMTWALARRLFPGDALRTSLAVAVTGLLPMNLYMSAYVSNEQLHGAFVSLALLVACRLLMEPGALPRRLAWLSVVLALAVLTKYTSVLLVPVVVFYLVVKHWCVDGRGLGRALLVGSGVAAGVLVLAGWFYYRNWIHFGNPLVGNWDATGQITWWEQPGFHTLAYYTRFGTALTHPFFAGYASFWDGIYSTLWGDGLVAGMIRLATRHPQWNYDFMILTYALALPATLLAPLGFVRSLRLAMTDPDPGRRCAHALLATALFSVAFALLRVTISLPYYAQAKAFYAIAVIVPLSLTLALGLSAVPERLGRTRPGSGSGGPVPLLALYYGWLGTLAGVIALAFLG